MTIEHRLVFELGDLRTIRLKCVTCGAVISVGLRQQVRIPDVCPSCLERLRERTQPQLTEPLTTFVTALKALLDAPQLSVTLQLEIEPPPH